MNRLLFATLLVVALLSSPAFGGEPFPDIVLGGEMPSVYRVYLETNKTPPKLSDVAAPYLLIYFFNVYCEQCAKDIPSVNKVFELLDGQGFSSRIKMLGLGVNNSQFEINFFRNKYSVPMPCFPLQDPIAKLHHVDPEHPNYVLVYLNRNKKLETIFHKETPITTAENLTTEVLRAAGYGN